MSLNWTNADTPPPEGIEVIGFSPDWIHEDYNPEGTRLCFRDGLSGWLSAKWNNSFDEWEVDETPPTHWMSKPSPPKPPTDESNSHS